MMQSFIRRVRLSLQAPVSLSELPASFIGIQERNQWIRENRLLNNLDATEVVIKILGSDYDSLEALLAVTIETADDRLKGIVEKDDIIYRTTSELILVSRFLAEGNRAYKYGRILLEALRKEKERRNQEDYLGRSLGMCCSTRSVRGRECGCEKGMPEQWEIGRSVH